MNLKHIFIFSLKTFVVPNLKQNRLFLFITLASGRLKSKLSKRNKKNREIGNIRKPMCRVITVLVCAFF